MKALWDFLRAAGFGLFLLGLVSFLVGVTSGYPAFREMRSWPAVEAEVMQSEVVSRASRSFIGRGVSGTVYTAVFVFRSRVNDREYLSQKEIGYRSSSEAEMAKWVNRFPEGSHHIIRYDPKNPLRISLAVGFDSASFAPTLALWRWALTLIAAGGLLSLVSKHFGERSS